MSLIAILDPTHPAPRLGLRESATPTDQRGAASPCFQRIGKVGDFMASYDPPKGKVRVPRPADTYRWYRREHAKLVRKGKGLWI